MGICKCRDLANFYYLTNTKGIKMLFSRLLLLVLLSLSFQSYCIELKPTKYIGENLDFNVVQIRHNLDDPKNSIGLLYHISDCGLVPSKEEFNTICKVTLSTFDDKNISRPSEPFLGHIDFAFRFRFGNTNKNLNNITKPSIQTLNTSEEKINFVSSFYPAKLNLIVFVPSEILNSLPQIISNTTSKSPFSEPPFNLTEPHKFFSNTLRAMNLSSIVNYDFKHTYISLSNFYPGFDHASYTNIIYPKRGRNLASNATIDFSFYFDSEIQVDIKDLFKSTDSADDAFEFDVKVLEQQQKFLKDKIEVSDYKNMDNFELITTLVYHINWLEYDRRLSEAKRIYCIAGYQKSNQRNVRSCDREYNLGSRDELKKEHALKYMPRVIEEVLNRARSLETKMASVSDPKSLKVDYFLIGEMKEKISNTGAGYLRQVDKGTSRRQIKEIDRILKKANVCVHHGTQCEL